MNKFNVTLQAAVNVRVPGVEATTPQEAIEAALDMIDLYSCKGRSKIVARGGAKT